MSAGLRTRVEYSVALLVQVVSQPRRGGTCAGAQKTASAPRYTSHLSNTPVTCMCAFSLRKGKRVGGHSRGDKPLYWSDATPCLRLGARCGLDRRLPVSELALA